MLMICWKRRYGDEDDKLMKMSQIEQKLKWKHNEKNQLFVIKHKTIFIVSLNFKMSATNSELYTRTCAVTCTYE